jgi:hypothetical protein
MTTSQLWTDIAIDCAHRGKLRHMWLAIIIATRAHNMEARDVAALVL